MIESINNKVVFSVDENMTFPFPYRFFRKEDLQVFLDEKKLQIGTDYSIQDKTDYSLGANITLNVAEAKGKNLVVLRVLPVIQETSLPEKGKLPSGAIETQLDKIIMIQQQFGEELERCAKLPVYTQTDAVEYLENLVTVTVNSKDVALNAAVAAANSAQTAAISERNVSLIWAEITGDPTLAENALLTVKEAAEATGAITTAKEIAIGEITNIGATAIAATNKAATEAKEAADQATNTAGSITGTVADEITIQISQAVGAEGALGAAILGGIQDVENARQQALDKANETLSQFREGTAEFENAKQQGLSQIDQKVAGAALDVETVLARAQLIADNYLDNAQATVSGSITDLEKMKEDALAAGNKALAELAQKRIEELQNLQKLLDDADSAASAADQFRAAAQSSAGDAYSSAEDALSQALSAAGSATNASNSASGAAASAEDALKSALDAALSASNAHASELAASQTATNVSNELVSTHNYSSSAHKNLFDSKLSLSGGTMTGTITCSLDNVIARSTNANLTLVCGGTSWENGGSIALHGKSQSDNPGGVIIYAKDGTQNSSMLLKPDGGLSWNGKNIIRSVDGVNADSAGNVALNALPKTGGDLTGPITTNTTVPIKRNVDNQWIEMYGGTTYVNGAYLRLDGKGSVNAGSFTLRATNGSASPALVGTPAGGLSWDGKTVVCVSSWKSADGSSWYRKYSDGFIEQAGHFTSTTDANVLVTLNTAFTTNKYVAIIQSGDGTEWTDHGGDYAGNKTTTTFKVACLENTDNYWYACGY